MRASDPGQRAATVREDRLVAPLELRGLVRSLDGPPVRAGGREVELLDPARALSSVLSLLALAATARVRGRGQRGSGERPLGRAAFRLEGVRSRSAAVQREAQREGREADGGEAGEGAESSSHGVAGAESGTERVPRRAH